MSNRDIATELVISERTVARHVQNIFAKLAPVLTSRCERLRLGTRPPVSSRDWRELTIRGSAAASWSMRPMPTWSRPRRTVEFESANEPKEVRHVRRGGAHDPGRREWRSHAGRTCSKVEARQRVCRCASSIRVPTNRLVICLWEGELPGRRSGQYVDATLGDVERQRVLRGRRGAGARPAGAGRRERVAPLGVGGKGRPERGALFGAPEGRPLCSPLLRSSLCP